MKLSQGLWEVFIVNINIPFVCAFVVVSFIFTLVFTVVGYSNPVQFRTLKSKSYSKENSLWYFYDIWQEFNSVGNCLMFTTDGYFDWKPCNITEKSCPNTAYISNEIYKCKTFILSVFHSVFLMYSQNMIMFTPKIRNLRCTYICIWFYL